MTQTEVFHKGCIFKILDPMNCLDDTHQAILCTATGLCPQVVMPCVQEALLGSDENTWRDSHSTSLQLRGHEASPECSKPLDTAYVQVDLRAPLLRVSSPLTSWPRIRSGRWVSAKPPQLSM